MRIKTLKITEQKHYQVDEEEAQSVATEIGARWFETSSAVDGKVEILIKKIVRAILDRNETESHSEESEG